MSRKKQFCFPDFASSKMRLGVTLLLATLVVGQKPRPKPSREAWLGWEISWFGIGSECFECILFCAYWKWQGLSGWELRGGYDKGSSSTMTDFESWEGKISNCNTFPCCSLWPLPDIVLFVKVSWIVWHICGQDMFSHEINCLSLNPMLLWKWL